MEKSNPILPQTLRDLTGACRVSDVLSEDAECFDQKYSKVLQIFFANPTNTEALLWLQDIREIEMDSPLFGFLNILLKMLLKQRSDVSDELSKIRGVDYHEIISVLGNHVSVLRSVLDAP